MNRLLQEVSVCLGYLAVCRECFTGNSDTLAESKQPSSSRSSHRTCVYILFMEAHQTSFCSWSFIKATWLQLCCLSEYNSMKQYEACRTLFYHLVCVTVHTCVLWCSLKPFTSFMPCSSHLYVNYTPGSQSCEWNFCQNNVMKLLRSL